MSDAKTTYIVQVRCYNCGWTGSKEIVKGTKIAREACPNCDCIALVLRSAFRGE